MACQAPEELGQGSCGQTPALGAAAGPPGLRRKGARDFRVLPGREESER